MSENKMVTAAEADHLEKQRPVPEAIPTLTPGGSLQYQTDYDMQRMRERRIAFIRNRLALTSEKSHRDHARAVHDFA